MKKTALRATLLIATLTLFVGACNTGPVIPKTVQHKAISFSGNSQTAGIIDNGVDYVIEPRLRDKYNALIERYGKRMLPPVTKDFGITPTSTNTFVITSEALVNFLQMNQWAEQGRK